MSGNTATWDKLQELLRTIDVDLEPTAFRICGVTGLGSSTPGEHLAVRSRSVLTGKVDAIWHHGIYVGDGDVVHMHPDGNISRVNLDTFALGATSRGRTVDTAVVIIYKGDTDRWRSWSCELALSALHTPEMKDLVYDEVLANCEHFASWCRTLRCEDLRLLLSQIGPRRQLFKSLFV